MTEQNAREAMEAMELAGRVVLANAGGGPEAAASVITAKLAEKDAEIARLKIAIYSREVFGQKVADQSKIHSEKLDRIIATIEQNVGIKPESPDHD